MPPSSPAGSAGFSGFVRALSQNWRQALGRFLLGVVGASLLWAAVGPAYAWGVAGVARLAGPALAKTPGTRYEVAGSRVHAIRPLSFPRDGRPREIVYIVWAAASNFGLPLLVALIVATPGWSWRARTRALAWGLGLLTLTQIASMLVTFEFWQQMPMRDPAGGLVYLPGHSALGLRIARPLYYFFEITGRGYFALLVYVGLLVLLAEPHRVTPEPARRRRA